MEKSRLLELIFTQEAQQFESHLAGQVSIVHAAGIA